MNSTGIALRAVALVTAVALLGLVACGDKADKETAESPGDASATLESAPLQASTTTWTPEALEELLAPVALYPDPILSQMLVAVTNPQEVLDAGNWLIANPDISGNKLDDAAAKVGFTMPMRSMMQFPEVIDQMCLNMGWTEELGQAYVNDQAGVMDAVQRLRAQAVDVGTLADSKQLNVETAAEGGKEIIIISPPNPNVVYVPQYNPQVVYAPPAAAAPTVATTTTTEEKGFGAGSLLLAFGAGMLVNEVFDDDEDDYYHHGHYGGMYYRPMPYYPPYPYRPAYGNGFYPENGYKRPVQYNRGGNTINIDNSDNYYGRYNDRNSAGTRDRPQSPITAARPKRADLSGANVGTRENRAREAPATADAWKGKQSYAGANPGARGAGPVMPKVQGSYAGAQPAREISRPTTLDRASRDAPARESARPAQSIDRSGDDRGRASGMDRLPAPRANDMSSRPAARESNAFSNAGVGAGAGRADRAASARGRSSMSSGGGSRGSGGQRPRRR
ncbi:MAG: DUF3300 domain-containing protein [Pseudomonadota bacterium]|nr:DUF3300 domain-containing protein [Pseudomonadota bacterium]